MNIEITNKTKTQIDGQQIKKVASAFLKKYKKGNNELSIAFIGDKKMQKINYEYRKINRPTDILSFSGEGDYFGELIIDLNQIKRQAKKFNNTPKQELIFILVHGLFHLLGFNDETDEDREKMIKMGEDFINKL